MSDDEGGSAEGRSSSPVYDDAHHQYPEPSTCAHTDDDAHHQPHSCQRIAERLGSVDPSETSAPSYSQYQHHDDDPPPYASLIGAASEHHRHAWSYLFPSVPYEDAPAENRSIARPLVTIPLTSYRIFKIEPPRYSPEMRPLSLQHPGMLAEAGPAVKSSTGTARKYGAILIAATVIIFLMALSLMVRFVTEKSLWRG